MRNWMLWVGWVRLVVLGGLAAGVAAEGRAADAAEVRHVDAAGAAELVKQTNVVILDIRTPKEFETVRLKGATNLDYRSPTFREKLATLDRNRVYLLHCATGRRSTESLVLFKELGFKTVVHLDGGITAWQKAGKPVEP